MLHVYQYFLCDESVDNLTNCLFIQVKLKVLLYEFFQPFLDKILDHPEHRFEAHVTLPLGLD